MKTTEFQLSKLFLGFPGSSDKFLPVERWINTRVWPSEESNQLP
ncbi:hypothetical protein ACU8KH_04527 [Lachancea thermotolerans]